MVSGPLVLWSLGHHASSLFANWGGATSSPTPALFRLYKATSSIILPAKAEPIRPLSEPVIKTSCVQMGCAAPTPPLFFFKTVQAFFQEPCIISKTCFARTIVIDLFKKPSCRQSICKEGGCLPPTPGLAKTEAIWTFSTTHAGSLFANGGYVSPNPRAFLNCARRLQVSSCQQKQNPCGPFRTHAKEVVFAMGGAAPAFFLTPCGLAFKRFANGGATSPEARWTLSESVTVFANGGGGCTPPQSSRFLSTPRRPAFKNIAPSTRLASRASLF